MKTEIGLFCDRKASIFIVKIDTQDVVIPINTFMEFCASFFDEYLKYLKAKDVLSYNELLEMATLLEINAVPAAQYATIDAVFGCCKLQSGDQHVFVVEKYLSELFRKTYETFLAILKLTDKQILDKLQ